jgi:hypothetical protein
MDEEAEMEADQIDFESIDQRICGDLSKSDSRQLKKMNDWTNSSSLKIWMDRCRCASSSWPFARSW